MRILLDTHVFVWAIGRSDRLSSRARGLLLDPANDLYLSVASAWELTIKEGMGKLVLPVPVDRFVAEGCGAAQIAVLPIELGHLAELARLPLHHRDPFDRMLVAQARREGLALLSEDAALTAYDVARA